MPRAGRTGRSTRVCIRVEVPSTPPNGPSAPHSTPQGWRGRCGAGGTAQPVLEERGGEGGITGGTEVGGDEDGERCTAV